jgi:hypothetical protein
MTVGCRQEEKCDIIHIKVPCLSNVFDMVCFTSNSQSDPIFVFNSFISDSIINNSKRSIEDDLLVSDNMPLDSTSQCIVKIKKVDRKNTLALKFSTSSLSKFFSSYGYSGLNSKRSKSRAFVKFDANIVNNFKASGMRSAKKGTAEWVDEKFEPFVCLALKPSPQKHRLEKIKYNFDLTLCDNLFDIFLENKFIKLFDHKVSPSPLELEDRKYCNWHNSFNHNTSDFNIFRQFIQSAIDTGQLRFAQTREDDQLATIGFDGKGSLNRLASAGLSKDPDLIAKEEDSNLSSVEKDIVHNLQDQVIFGDNEPIKIPEFTGGQKDFSSSSPEPLPVLESQVRPMQPKGQTGDPQVRPVQPKGLTGASVKKSEMSKSEHPVANGGKDHVKHNGKRPKLTFDKLLAKYQKDNEAKRANQSNKVKSSRLHPKHNSGNWNRQGKSSQAAATYSPFEPSMSVSYAPYPFSDHPYSSWEWSDLWTHTPSYFRPYHVEYAAPRRPLRARQSYVESDHFEYQDRSSAENKKRVVKQVYQVKRDGHKDKSSDLNSVNKKSINVFNTLAIGGKGKENHLLILQVPNLGKRS